MAAFRKLYGAFAAVLVLMLSATAPAWGTSVLPLYLDQVIDAAAVAFEGTCVSNRTEHDPATGFVVTYTTFEVKDVLKGDIAATHTIKQIGGKLDGDRVDRAVDGIPRFAPGQDYVVFLLGVSPSGFSSPVGLSQGSFGIRVSGAARTLSNGRDFRDIASRMMASVPSAAAVHLKAGGSTRDMDVEQFKETVRNYLGAKR